MLKQNKILDYANLELFDLKVLNEIRSYIKEICSLKDEGIVDGIDVDIMLKKIKLNYKNLLKQV